MDKGLNLCIKHKQESNGSHYAECNCDYCKLLAEVERLNYQLQDLQTRGEYDAGQRSMEAVAAKFKHERDELKEVLRWIL